MVFPALAEAGHLTLAGYGAISAISGAAFGASYIGSMRTTWDAYDALKQPTASTMPSMPNYTGTVSGLGPFDPSKYLKPFGDQTAMGFVPTTLSRDDALRVVTQSARDADALAQQRAEELSKLPSGALVNADGSVSYMGEIYYQKMPSNYAIASQQAAETQYGPHLYRTFNYAGYSPFNWPQFFYGTAGYTRRRW